MKSMIHICMAQRDHQSLVNSHHISMGWPVLAFMRPAPKGKLVAARAQPEGRGGPGSCHGVMMHPKEEITEASRKTIP
jgi:hypothetical protein